MANAKGKPSSGKVRNDNRACGKAAKKHPKTTPAKTGRGKPTGRTIAGYSKAKLRKRAEHRGLLAAADRVINA